jgi:CHAT domain-containing protein
LTHVWWCPTGPLTFLPLHAAGLYGAKAIVGSKLSDYVVSSYTPTLSSLIHGYSQKTPADHQVLAVALPEESKLSGTQDELDYIAKHVRPSNIEQLVEKAATVKNVKAGMKESTIVHFACHGVQHPTNPTESALLLANNSKLTLLDISQISFHNAQLAFLSACQTATGYEKLPEEAVHLAAGMLSAGYRGVIATMWSIKDSDAPLVTDEVYAELFKDSKPDASQAALALHKAVKKLVEGSVGTKSFLAWVPFIHIGI